MSETKVKAVLFDFGETLLNFGKVSTAGLFRRGARLSYDFLKSCGRPVGNFRYYCWRNLFWLRACHLISRLRGKDFDSLALLKKQGVKKGNSLSHEQWRQLAWLWYEPLSKIGRTEPDIEQTLARLKESGLKLGIVSNTFVHGSCLEKHLQQVGILDFFDIRLYSYQFNFRKPDPRIFLEAADRIGERFENIVFVGDRIDKDITPALKLGMTAVAKTAYTNLGREIPGQAHKIDHLSELPDLIEKINKKSG